MIKQNLREELLLSETIEKGMKGEENLSAQVTVFHKNAEIVSDAEIEQSLKNLVSESLSENTIKTYRGALRRLGAFMDIEEKAGVDLLLRKLDDSSLARYVAVLETKGKAPATAQMTIAAISYIAKLRAEKSPAGRLTDAAMRGFRRRCSDRGRGQARGITWTQSEKIVASVLNNPDSLTGIRDAALISLMSDAMLRISEAASLLVSDIVEEADGSGRINIRRSKTDQEGRGTVLYLGYPTMARIRTWMEISKVKSGALFRRVSRGNLKTSCVGETSLSPLSIRRILKTRAEEVGIDGVSGHSLRVGAAQSMAVGGATLVDMQIAGRWKSAQMPARYARYQLAERNAVARLRYGR
ncbi:MAG: tyrosine-type recombinase/integrase [Candidatus Dadabacteria bacterium]|nr:tyrosine-type recombinase/integrase [Candidatus Dadabacteria bacterium]